MRFWRSIVCLVILTASAVGYSQLPGRRDFGVFALDPPTPYFHYTPVGTSRGRILVVHGLDASKNVMNLLSFALAEGGFEVYSIDLAGHGDSTVPFNAVTARDEVAKVIDSLGPGTIVLGHSLGSALLLDISQNYPFQKMVLFSPAPIPLERVQAESLLVLTGQFDPEPIRTFAKEIQLKASGSVQLRTLAWTGHSGGLWRPGVIADIVHWLGGKSEASHMTLRLGLLGLIAISGFVAGSTLMGTLPPAPARDPFFPSLREPLLSYTFAALLAASILSLINVVAWIRIFAMDYVVGFVFLTGLFLLFRFQPQGTIAFRDVLIALSAAVGAILLFVLFGTEFAHVSMSQGRWWRFAALTSAGLPLFLADETLLRSLIFHRRAALISRLVLVSVAISGVLILNRSSAFFLLLSPLVFLFWLVLWFVTGLTAARTGPFAAALFAAVLQAWMFSTLFVIT